MGVDVAVGGTGVGVDELVAVGVFVGRAVAVALTAKSTWVIGFGVA
jgi:hypothetical protein